MIEFDYNLDYKNLMFEKNDKRYRIGRGEQGVLLVRPYTDVICRHTQMSSVGIGDLKLSKRQKYLHKKYLIYI